MEQFRKKKVDEDITYRLARGVCNVPVAASVSLAPFLSVLSPRFLLYIKATYVCSNNRYETSAKCLCSVS